jgi:RNA polymerase sigma-70 factor (ECF subfamily)
MNAATIEMTQQDACNRLAQLDDNALMLLTRNGDHDAFMELVRRYRQLMVNYVYRLVWDYDTASELAQEVFVRLFRSIDRYDHRLKFSTWIYKIATNLAIDEARRRKRHPVLPFSPEIESLPDDHAARHNPRTVQAPNPEQAVLREEAHQAVMAALQELPDDHRQLFVLKEMEQLPLEEISRITGVKVGTLKSRLFRSREFLRDRLTGYFHRGPAVS